MSRRSRSAIVCAGDEKFFAFAKGLILSIRAHFGTRFDIHFIDLGLSSRSVAWLESQDAAVTRFDFRSVISMKRNPTLPDYIGAMICRPMVPSLLPGYETYIWMDSDTWIQCPQSVIAFEAAARYGGDKIAISSTDPWVYGLNDVQRTQFEQYSRTWYGALFGATLAASYCRRKILNSGFFALSAGSKLWKSWEREVLRFYGRPHPDRFVVHVAEQTALNYVCYQTGQYVEFNSVHNFNCHIAAATNIDGVVRVAAAPAHTIGVVHLTASGRHGAEYVEKRLLYAGGDYLTAEEKSTIRSLNHC